MNGTKLLNLDVEPLPQPVTQSASDSFLAGAEGVFLEECISRIYDFQLILSPGLRDGPIDEELGSLRQPYRDSTALGDHLHILSRTSAPYTAGFFGCRGLHVFFLVCLGCVCPRSVITAEKIQMTDNHC